MVQLSFTESSKSINSKKRFDQTIMDFLKNQLQEVKLVGSLLFL
jgi:hypothetical protein